MNINHRGLDIDHAFAHGCDEQRGRRGDIHLTEQISPVRVDSFRTHAKSISNFTITQSARQFVQNLVLAVGQFAQFLKLVYLGLYRRRDNTVSRQHIDNTGANVLRAFTFDKQAINAGVEKFFQQWRGGLSRNYGKFCFRRPSFSFQENLQPIGARHSQIQQCAIRFFAFNFRNRVDTIRGHTHNLNIGDALHDAAHTVCAEGVVIRDNDSFRDTKPSPSRRKKFFFRAAVVLGLLAAGSSHSFAQSNPSDFVSVNGPLTVKQLSSHMTYYEDRERTAQVENLANDKASDFVPLNMIEPDFGYTDSRIWLRAKLKNTSDELTDWRIYVRENFLQNYAVYVERQGGDIERIEEHSPATPFSDRLIDYPELVTPINFEPGEAITLFIAYWSEGSSNAAISFETAESFSKKAVSRTSKNFIFYGMVSLLIAGAILGLVILRLPVFLAYLFYVTLTLIYLMHVDGVTFQYFWPEHPRFNSYFTIIIGTAFVLATYNFARAFLQTKKYEAEADRVLFWMGAVTPFITIPGAFIDPQLTKQIIMPLILLGIIAGTFVGFMAARTRFKQVRFYLFAWMFGIFAAGLMNMRHVFGLDISQDTEFDSIRISMVVDSVMMGLAIGDRYIQTMKSRERETNESLKTAQQNLKLNQRLFDLEERYELATELVLTKDEAFSNTIHDLRQPLHALRLNIQNFAQSGEQNDADTDKIGEMFSYLEQLLSAQLDSALAPDEFSDDVKEVSSEESIDVQKVLESVHEMFLPDAMEKGLSFRFIPSRHTAPMEPFTLIRIMNNLVSNAIKYTPGGKIVMCARRLDKVLRIEVHDTGIGMSAEAFEHAKTRRVRLDEGQAEASGEGLGLSIASDLAEQNGLRLYRSPYRENGTSLILEIPL